jgi:hypothetical protein
MVGREVVKDRNPGKMSFTSGEMKREILPSASTHVSLKRTELYGEFD